MRVLDEIEEWCGVVVYAPGEDPYGPFVVDGPVSDLMRRTAYLKARLSGSYLWLPYLLAAGEVVEVGDVVCMGASNDEQIKKAVAAAFTQAGVALGIVVGEPNNGYAPVAISGLVPASITGLGSGTAGELVCVDKTTARAMRGYDGAGVQFVLGRANLGGTLQLNPDQTYIAA